LVSGLRGLLGIRGIYFITTVRSWSAMQSLLYQHWAKNAMCFANKTCFSFDFSCPMWNTVHAYIWLQLNWKGESGYDFPITSETINIGHLSATPFVAWRTWSKLEEAGFDSSHQMNSQQKLQQRKDLQSTWFLQICDIFHSAKASTVKQFRATLISAHMWHILFSQ